MRIVLLGAPGSGKGTEAKILSEKLNIPHISTGDILRRAIAEKTPLGRKAKSYVEGGGLVPDEVMVGLVEERLRKDDSRNGFILDGFPRTLAQAETLRGTLEGLGSSLDLVLHLDGQCHVCSGLHADLYPENTGNPDLESKFYLVYGRNRHRHHRQMVGKTSGSPRSPTRHGNCHDLQTGDYNCFPIGHQVHCHLGPANRLCH